ncbi:MAG: Ig-like domain-containing protein [bacterium]|jgi:hypothetical protein
MKHIFKFSNKRLFAWAICLLVVLSILAAPLVNAGTGSGDGSGGGKGNALSLAESSPADGEQDIPVAIEIKLVFNKNIVHMTVHDENKQCFSLYTADGIAVPIEVIMADDQMEPEKRRDVILKPQKELAPGTTYKVRVAPTLRSKSGVTLGTETVVTFTTRGATPAAMTAPDVSTSNNGDSGQNTDTNSDNPSSDLGDVPVSSELAREGDTAKQPAAEPPTQETPFNSETEIDEPANKSGIAESDTAQPKNNSTAVAFVLAALALGWFGYRSYKKYKAQ